MWQYELVQSAGSVEKASSSNYPTSDLIATFTYAVGVSTTLSLPWSLFEHMAGNWLITVTDPIQPADLTDLIARYAADLPEQTRSHLRSTVLPGTTAGLLESVLAAGRRYFDTFHRTVGEGEEGARVSLMPAR